jgi:hypothetical protein
VVSTTPPLSGDTPLCRRFFFIWKVDKNRKKAYTVWLHFAAINSEESMKVSLTLTKEQLASLREFEASKENRTVPGFDTFLTLTDAGIVRKDQFCIVVSETPNSCDSDLTDVVVEAAAHILTPVPAIYIESLINAVTKK